jgi:hypothetical protein
MQNEFVKQFAHLWRLFERVVNDFDEDAWRHSGRRTAIPVR